MGTYPRPMHQMKFLLAFFATVVLFAAGALFTSVTAQAQTNITVVTEGGCSGGSVIQLGSLPATYCGYEVAVGESCPSGAPVTDSAWCVLNLIDAGQTPTPTPTSPPKATATATVEPTATPIGNPDDYDARGYGQAQSGVENNGVSTPKGLDKKFPTPTPAAAAAGGQAAGSGPAPAFTG